jgi:hypothetical protein
MSTDVNSPLYNHLPAVVRADGTKEWYVNGKHHRHPNQGPAIEYEDGSKEWWWHGKRHRYNNSDLPAIEKSNGLKLYYVNGVVRMHRR